MSYLDLVNSEMEKSGEEPAYAGEAREEIIEAFEKKLNLKFPPSYKAFLKRFGALSFAGDTYYGITKDGLDSKSVPCVAFATQKARFQNDADDNMVVIKASGYGPIYSIDTSIVDSNGESPIIETELSFKRDKEKITVSPSFEEFFTQSIQDAIEEL